MRCPYCKDRTAKSRVIDSREVDEGDLIRRRRECTGCNERYTTYERFERKPLKVIKRSEKGEERWEEFDSDKILRSLKLACRKLPVEDENLARRAQQIEKQIRDISEHEVKSQFIGDRILQHLLDVDRVAYLRYLSVYQKFSALEDFRVALNSLLTAQGKTADDLLAEEHPPSP